MCISHDNSALLPRNRSRVRFEFVDGARDSSPSSCEDHTLQLKRALADADACFHHRMYYVVAGCRAAGRVYAIAEHRSIVHVREWSNCKPALL